MRFIFRRQAFTILIFVSLAACQNRAAPEPESREDESSTATKKSLASKASKKLSAREAPPNPYGDPPASAWEYSGSEDYAGLKMHFRGAPLAEAKSAFIIFHGYGANGDDLVSLSRVIKAGSHTALLFPEAPVALSRGGRAWFRRDRSNFELGVKRAQALLASIAEKHSQVELLVGGFSQGAMLTANLVEQSERKLKAAVLFSPADLLLQPLTGSSTDTAIFLSHGKVDPVLPFAGGEALRDSFIDQGYSVSWVPFMGRHTIGRQVIGELNLFLAALSLGAP